LVFSNILYVPFAVVYEPIVAPVSAFITLTVNPEEIPVTATVSVSALIYSYIIFTSLDDIPAVKVSTLGVVYPSLSDATIVYVVPYATF
jgi:hypothetical protein